MKKVWQKEVKAIHKPEAVNVNVEGQQLAKNCVKTENERELVTFS